MLPEGDEYSSDEDWVPEPIVGTPASKPVQVQKVIYKVSGHFEKLILKE